MRIALFLLLVIGLTGCASNPGRSGDEEDARQKKLAALNVQLGSGYMQEGRYEVALERLNKALQYDPDSANAHTVLAILYERIRKPEQAEQHYRKAVELQPDNGDAQNNLGTFLCRQQKYDQAEAHFRKAWDNPFYKTPAVALTNAGSCALQAGKLQDAEAYLRQALRMDSNYPDALFLLARLMHEQGNHFKARAFLQRYEATGQVRPDAYWLGYRIEYALGDLKASQAYARRLRQQFPEARETRLLNKVDKHE